MRNPIRLKNLRLRFLPLFLLALAVLLLVPPSPTGLALALPPIALGLALRTWGAGHLVKGHDLTVAGPYAHLRHPLYAGTLLIASGFALLPWSPLSVVLLVAIWGWFGAHYLPRKERSESARLESLHGEAFSRYRAAVPLLWPRRLAWAEARGLDEAGSAWSLARYSENNELGTLLAVLAGLGVFGLRLALAGA